jgi:hypothetical protein
MLDEYKHEREQLFDRAFNKQFGRIEDYRFRGFNHALGCFVESKDHYKRLMKRKGLIPADAAEEIAEDYRAEGERRKDLTMSDEAEGVIRAIRASTRRKDGTIELSGRLVEAMVKMGAVSDRRFEVPDPMSGGFI